MPNMGALNSSITNFRTDCIIKKKAKEDLDINLARIKSELDSKVEYATVLEQTNILLQKTGEYQRTQSCRQIELIGTSALQYIMGPDFKLEVELKDIRRVDGDKQRFQADVRKRPEAEIYIVSVENGMEVRNRPQDSRGGGIVDIVSMAMRIGMLEAVDPPIDGPLILDEPGKHVSEEYIVAFAEFINTISRQLDRQIIMVTHSPYMAASADKKFNMNIENGVSKVISTSTKL